MNSVLSFYRYGRFYELSWSFQFSDQCREEGIKYSSYLDTTLHWTAHLFALLELNLEMQTLLSLSEF